MAISFDLSAARRVAAAASHYYAQATEPLYLDRVLTHHDLIYLREGAWAITEGDTEYPLERDDVLLLTAGHHHYTRLPRFGITSRRSCRPTGAISRIRRRG